MDIREITPDYAVSPQITPEDMPAIAAAGYATVICNRPDGENPPDLHAGQMAKAANDAGLRFIEIPVTHQSLNLDIVAQQKNAIAEAAGPILAYCASGTRSTIVWGLASAGDIPIESILKAATQAGYDLSGFAGQIEALAEQP